MKFDRSLGCSEFRPREHAQAKVDHSGVEAEQLVAESEFLAGSDLLAFTQKLIKQRLVKLPWTLGVGVAERRLVRGLHHSHMPELAHTAGKAAAYLPQTSSPAQAGRTASKQTDPMMKIA